MEDGSTKYVKEHLYRKNKIMREINDLHTNGSCVDIELDVRCIKQEMIQDEEPEPNEPSLSVKEEALGNSWADLRNAENSQHAKLPATEYELQSEMYKCDFCEKAHRTRDILRLHVITVHGSACCKCKKCNKIFQCKQYLLKHLALAHVDKTYKCEDCGKVFKNKMVMQRHLKELHTTIKHECNICHSVFARKYNMQQHITYAHGNETHECDLCNRLFKTKSHLYDHVRQNHAPNRYECPVCHHKYKQKGSLKYHVFHVHGSESRGYQKHKCDMCFKEFKWRSSLLKHERSGVCSQLHVVRHSVRHINEVSELCIQELKEEFKDEDQGRTPFTFVK